MSSSDETFHDRKENSEYDSTLDNTQDLSGLNESEEKDQVWARLVPTNTKYPTLELKDNETLIGRDPNCDIHLQIPQMSNKHCIIKKEQSGQEAILQDTSSNGTWINKLKIHKKFAFIKAGDEITFIPGSKKRKRAKISFTFYPLNINLKELKVEHDYILLRSLGAGAFAEVKLAKHRKTNKNYAVKIIDQTSWEKMKHATKRKVELLDEVEIMRKANHKNIVKVHEYFVEESGKVYVVMDYCDGGDMLEYIQKNGIYEETKARNVFRQLVEAIEYLHSLKIAHRDLKPDNILLVDKTSNSVRISDFGISRKSSESMFCKTVIGTPLYQAPEVHSQKEKRHNKNHKGYDGKLSDYWSLGIILYIMLVAAPPAAEPKEIVELVKERNLNYYGEDVSETADDLLYKLLNINPNERIKAQQIYKHPWILGFRTFKEHNRYLSKQRLTYYVNTNTNNNNSHLHSNSHSNINDNIIKTNNDLSAKRNPRKRKQSEFDSNPPSKRQKNNSGQRVRSNSPIME